MINLIAPINSLGYGVVGHNLLKSLLKINPSTALYPISQPEFSDEHIEKAMKNRGQFKLFPSVKIWHQNDVHTHIGKGEHVGFPIFELDKFNDVEKHHLAKLDQIFVCSEWAKTVVLMNVYRPASDVQVIPLGVDVNTFKPKLNQSEKTIFFNCGKWEIRKGHDVLVNIFNKAFDENDNVELWMMTTNPFLSKEEDNQWKKLYLNSRLGDKIKFIDRVNTHKEVYNIMSRTDCGIFPSKAEGWNLELLEMLSCGKKVITTNYSAHTEFCNDDNAYLVEVDSKEVAYDGKWFHGNSGSWAKISDKEIDIFVDYMRNIHQLKQDNNLTINQAGVETANKFTWQNSALKIQKDLNG